MTKRLARNFREKIEESKPHELKITKKYCL